VPRKGIPSHCSYLSCLTTISHLKSRLQKKNEEQRYQYSFNGQDGSYFVLLLMTVYLSSLVDYCFSRYSVFQWVLIVLHYSMIFFPSFSISRWRLKQEACIWHVSFCSILLYILMQIITKIKKLALTQDRSYFVLLLMTVYLSSLVDYCFNRYSVFQWVLIVLHYSMIFFPLILKRQASFNGF
jgi:uncharacterized protein with ParB-like and HNH nuclease domain